MPFSGLSILFSAKDILNSSFLGFLEVTVSFKRFFFVIASISNDLNWISKTRNHQSISQLGLTTMRKFFDRFFCRQTLEIETFFNISRQVLVPCTGKKCKENAQFAMALEKLQLFDLFVVADVIFFVIFKLKSLKNRVFRIYFSVWGFYPGTYVFFNLSFFKASIKDSRGWNIAFHFCVNAFRSHFSAK